MTPKEISRAASGIFGGMIPANWAKRDQEDQEDYGLDYEFEVMEEDDKPTGFIFKLQQKGAVKLKLNRQRTHVTYNKLSTEKLRYYLRELRIPVVLVLVDITTRRVFWCTLHGNPSVEAAFEQAASAGRKSLTVRIPVENEFPATAY